ncbi:MAG: nucleotidyltransferase family protein [Bacteroidales bacterium]|jgi:D-glycero-alpha-D-manno-heptose 1-phosphate guanylyltransferase|nr:nucleotidyltransferase family protein [Bacteroidales bacterium]
MNKITEALILAGGFGSRLKGIIKDVPKPLAPINGVPFLSILMKYLAIQGIKHFILSVGYKHEKIQNLYGHEFNGIPITYAIETEPLGTGGAIAYGLSFTKKHTDKNNVLVVNGDSFIRFSLSDLESTQLQNSEILIVLKPMQNFERYGSVAVSENRIIAFAEKEFVTNGLINSGVYVVPSNLFADKIEKKFSFEKDFLEKNVCKQSFHYLICDDYFIDIGIEDDYNQAQTTLFAIQSSLWQ